MIEKIHAFLFHQGSAGTLPAWAVSLLSLQDYTRRMRECDSSECEVDSICSVNKIEGRGSRLVECLRGRLLAERHDSKDAKQDADLLRKRVMELEIKLKEEIEIRDKVENKLQMLQKKA